MFGIGPQELLIIGLLALIVFGPKRLTSMARDFGRFVSGAQDTVEEFKSGLVSSEEVKEVRHTAEELKDELISARRSVKEFKGKLVSGEDQDEPTASDPHPEDKDKEVSEREEGKESPPLRKRKPHGREEPTAEETTSEETTTKGRSP
jgi:sec-independent protein translocase protein TatB